MTVEPDLFTEACINTYAPAPWLDAQRVGKLTCNPERDRDHVGEEAVGRVGNDRTVWVVRVEDKQGETLHSRTFLEDEREAAGRYLDELHTKIDRNRQIGLF